MKQIKEINIREIKIKKKHCSKKIKKKKNETTPQNKMKQKILSNLIQCHKYVNQEYQNCNIIF